VATRQRRILTCPHGSAERATRGSLQIVDAEAASATDVQRLSGGTSTSEIHDAALSSARPQLYLTWIDIGAGTGDVLRHINEAWSPSGLVAVDVLPWLASDLQEDVELHIGDPVSIAGGLAAADRVLLVETLEHVEAPWTLLRMSARLVKPGGILVVTTPNIVTLRHRLDLLARAELTSFRPKEPQHLTPVLPHVAELIMRQEGLMQGPRGYAGRDIVPFTGGRRWPGRLAEFSRPMLNISLVMAAQRPSVPRP